MRGEGVERGKGVERCVGGIAALHEAIELPSFPFRHKMCLRSHPTPYVPLIFHTFPPPPLPSPAPPPPPSLLCHRRCRPGALPLLAARPLVPEGALRDARPYLVGLGGSGARRVLLLSRPGALTFSSGSCDVGGAAAVSVAPGQLMRDVAAEARRRTDGPGLRVVCPSASRPLRVSRPLRPPWIDTIAPTA